MLAANGRQVRLRVPGTRTRGTGQCPEKELAVHRSVNLVEQFALAGVLS